VTIHRVLQPEGWPRPKGYANGIEARGRHVYVAGTIGWDPEGRFPHKDVPGQVRTALENTLAILREAGAGPEHIVRQTWYVTSRAEYLDGVREIGATWRELMGKNFPAMAVVEVTALMEAEAKVEIETTAVVPD
jgi:enamine deaminase RidA (YjgF/YER057c/UK114 family)